MNNLVKLSTKIDLIKYYIKLFVYFLTNFFMPMSDKFRSNLKEKDKILNKDNKKIANEELADS